VAQRLRTRQARWAIDKARKNQQDPQQLHLRNPTTTSSQPLQHTTPPHRTQTHRTATAAARYEHQSTTAMAAARYDVEKGGRNGDYLRYR